jgi:hypothetical protein
MSAGVWLLLGALLTLTLVAQGVWVYRKYETHRVRRFLGFGLGNPPEFGRFYWKEGVFAAEVTEAMSAEYEKKHRWLLSHRNQRLFVVLNVASWVLYVIGALDRPWNLGFSDSPFSWWALPTIGAFLLVRQSVRVLADAPDELIDERLASVRDDAYRTAYRIMGWVLPFFIGFAIGVVDSATVDLTMVDFIFGLTLFAFIHEALPSMVIAWRGEVREPTDTHLQPQEQHHE